MINHGTCLGLTAVVGHLVYIMRCGYISVQRIFSTVTTFIFSREIDHEKIQIYPSRFQCFNTLELKRRTLTILHSLCSKIRSKWINSLYVKYVCNPVCAGSGQFKPIYTFDSNNFWFCLYNVRHWDPSTSQKFQIFNWKSQLFGNFGYFPPNFHLIFHFQDQRLQSISTRMLSFRTLVDSGDEESKSVFRSITILVIFDRFFDNSKIRN